MALRPITESERRCVAMTPPAEYALRCELVAGHEGLHRAFSRAVNWHLEWKTGWRESRPVVFRG